MHEFSISTGVPTVLTDVFSAFSPYKFTLLSHFLIQLDAT